MSERAPFWRRLSDSRPGAGQLPDAFDSHVSLSLDERIAWVLNGAGFPRLLVERGAVVLSGFVLTPESARSVRVRWVGHADVNALPYRRTFLIVYIQTLLKAGLDVQYVDDQIEPYVICAGGLAPFAQLRS